MWCSSLYMNLFLASLFIYCKNFHCRYIMTDQIGSNRLSRCQGCHMHRLNLMGIGFLQITPKLILNRFSEWLWLKNIIGTISFGPSWTSYVISDQLRKFRSEIEKLVFVTNKADIGHFLKQIKIWIRWKVTRGHSSSSEVI